MNIIIWGFLSFSQHVAVVLSIIKALFKRLPCGFAHTITSTETYMGSLLSYIFEFQRLMSASQPEMIKVGVVTINVSSIGIKFENFMQAGCWDQGSHRGHTMYCRKPISLPKLILFFGKFLELPILPSIICDFSIECNQIHIVNSPAQNPLDKDYITFIKSTYW